MEYTEKDLKIFNKGVKEGQKHTTPSKGTINLIKEMKEALAEFGKKLTKISNSLIENNLNTKNVLEENKEHKKSITTLSKWSWVLTGAIGVIIFIFPFVLNTLSKNVVTKVDVQKMIKDETVSELRIGEIVRTIINSEYKQND